MVEVEVECPDVVAAHLAEEEWGRWWRGGVGGGAACRPDLRGPPAGGGAEVLRAEGAHYLVQLIRLLGGTKGTPGSGGAATAGTTPRLERLLNCL